MIITNATCHLQYTFRFRQQSPNPLWSKTGPQGVKWNLAKISINETSAYNIIFEAIAGPGDGGNGDIALDDIKLLDGPC